MLRKINLEAVSAVLLVMILLFCFNSLGLCYPRNDEADVVGNEGLMLIKAGNWEEGLEKLREAIRLAPEDPSWRMNYASMLFMKGRPIFEAGNKQEAYQIYKESEQELLAAIELFKKENNNILISHCYFLLGDINKFVFKDKDKAKNFYQNALKYDPRNSAAMRELSDLNVSNPQ